MNLFRAIATVSGITMISRLLGFIRDIMVAAVLGAGPLADVFFVAFKLPNLFRRLFAEGAFNAAFVPQFSGILTERGRHRAHEFAEQALAVLLWSLLIFVILVEIRNFWISSVDAFECHFGAYAKFWYRRPVSKSDSMSIFHST